MGLVAENWFPIDVREEKKAGKWWPPFAKNAIECEIQVGEVDSKWVPAP